ncbi:MAG: Phospho-N-acetylmuramoyl-pentapeptide-transferase [Alphaproteobacteria bacterium ADurb.Bin438]|nr:MAG: Phospho-N-acetylmuramoyl-pentapeptide-transferase [Alphaproteobacteria bacterium ADurb.Bin438]
MLYYFLYNYLFQLSDKYPALKVLNVVKYVTFRTGAAIITALIIGLIIGKPIINFMVKWQKGGQPIREDGPQSHFSKKGTPNMGGFIILISLFSSLLLWADVTNVLILITSFVVISFALIGFYDDYLKIKKKNAYNNFSGKLRLFLQFSVSAIAFYFFQRHTGYEFATTLHFPFFKNFTLDLGWFYFIFAGIVISGGANGVNLTDGLDGLCSGPTMISSGFFIIITYLSGHIAFANYLTIPYVEGSSELAIFCGAMFGGLMGFLWFNAYPAQIFMGDVGSLALGAALGIISVITKHEIVFAIVGGVFVIEVLSDIIQVGSYKLRKKRVFLMAPIHHHFEKKGLPETKIVIRFWILSIVFGLIGLATLKLR